MDLSQHVVGEVQSINEAQPRLVYTIETSVGTKRLSVAMNGEDDGQGTNNFDLYLIPGESDDLSNAVCSEDGLGQFAFCEVENPSPGNWRIIVDRKRGDGLVQLTVTRVP